MPPTAAEPAAAKKRPSRPGAWAAALPPSKQGVYVAKIHKARHGQGVGGDHALTISQAAVGEVDRIVDHVTSLLCAASREVIGYTSGSTLNEKIVTAAASTVFSGNLKRRALARAQAASKSFVAASAKSGPALA